MTGSESWHVHGTRLDLKDTPLLHAEETWFTDRSGFIQDGQRYVGVTEIIWEEPLPSGTFSQRAKLIALTKALLLGKNKKFNVYTDRQYAFVSVYIHGPIY